MTAEALRRRMAHGNVYAPEKVDAALANYFRPGNLNALRELALLWTADRVDEALQRLPRAARHHGHLGGPRAGRRRAHRRTRGRDADPPRGTDRRPLQRRRPARGPRRPLGRADRRQPGRAGRAATRSSRPSAAPTTRWSATTCPRPSSTFARAENATQLVLGDSRRTRRGPHVQPGHRPSARCASSGDIDVHIVTHAETGRGFAAAAWPRQPQHPTQGPGATSSQSLLPPLLTVCLTPFRGELNLVSDMLLFLLLTVVVALVGGLVPGSDRGRRRVGCCSTTTSRRPCTPSPSARPTTPSPCSSSSWWPRWSARPSTWPRDARDRRHAPPPSRGRWPTSPAASSRGDDALADMLQRVRETFALTSVTLLERGRRRLGGPGQRGDRGRPARVMRTRRCRPGTDWSSRCAARRSGPRTSVWSAPSRHRRLSCSTISGSAGRRPRPLRSRRRTRYAPRCSPPSATTSAPRSPPPRPRSRACSASTSSSQPRTDTSCSRRPTSRSTGWPAWSTTCST